jgi:hypothetical protein
VAGFQTFDRGRISAFANTPHSIGSASPLVYPDRAKENAMRWMHPSVRLLSTGVKK